MVRHLGDGEHLHQVEEQLNVGHPLLTGVVLQQAVRVVRRLMGAARPRPATHRPTPRYVRQGRSSRGSASRLLCRGSLPYPSGLVLHADGFRWSDVGGLTGCAVSPDEVIRDREGSRGVSDSATGVAPMAIGRR